ncbi:Fructose-1,6-bisphosphatase class 1 [Sesbania bispinosa]|nr:Fructose-1,6-bisphosphatase class 1 [Sesbania bispinosa]
MQSAATSPFYQLVSFRQKFQTFHSKTHLLPKGTPFCRPRIASVPGFGMRPLMALGGSSSSVVDDGFVTLIEYVGKGGINVKDDLVVLLDHIQYACKRIAALVASPFNYSLGKQKGPGAVPTGGSDRDAPKPLDIISNEIILSSLQKSGKVAVMASEENDAPTWISDDGPYVVVTDPLDGSRNIDASIPTGTIFGIYKRLEELDNLPTEEKAMLNSLQSGSRLIAAGYVLYSSATILCITFGSGTHAFTLDHSTGDFILTNPTIKIPPRGQIYSVNDARYFDWPEGLRQYIDTIRQGKEQAGGRGSDGKNRILSLQPVKLHQRLPLFLGSLEDMEELESYGDVQQKVNPGYEV